MTCCIANAFNQQHTVQSNGVSNYSSSSSSVSALSDSFMRNSLAPNEAQKDRHCKVPIMAEYLPLSTLYRSHTGQRKFYVFFFSCIVGSR